MISYVIPCSGRKTDHPAPARDLYTGVMFTHTLAAATAEVTWCQANAGNAQVLILSARHGLIRPIDVLAPYDTRITDPDAITPDVIAAQAAELGITWTGEVYAMLPAKYLAVLDAGLRKIDVYPQDVYEATSGIGDQRHVNTIVTA